MDQMEEPQQKLHDGLDYPESSLLDGSFVGKILPEGEPNIEAKKDEGALPKIGYGPKKQPRPSIGKSHDLLELTSFQTTVGSVISTWMMLPVRAIPKGGDPKK